MNEAIDAQHTVLAVREEVEPAADLALFNTSDPVEVIAQATRIADALKAVIVAKKLVSNIQGKEYPQVEAWQTLAAMLGLDTICEWSRPIEDGWEARVVVKRRGVEKAAAEAQCTRQERAWKSRDDYALRSMAQTRATSKSLRSVLGFIMVLAGYQPTPAEEMPRDGGVAAERAKTQQPPPPQPSDEQRQKGVIALLALCRERNISTEHRYAISERLFGRKHSADLNYTQLRELYKHISKGDA